MARKSRKHLQTEPPHIEKTRPTAPIYIAGIYARVSSEDKPDSSIKNQVGMAEHFINERPNIKLHKVYVDSGVSSFAAIRPSFEDMLYDIQTGTINCVIVKDISRFSRDYLEAGDLLQKKFPSWRTRFISIGDGFDSFYSDATGMQMALRTLLAYEYSKDLSKKISSVISFRQKNGDYIPPKLPYGYKKERTDSGVEWALDESAASTVKKIFNLTLDGNSMYSIACTLNENGVPAPGSKLWTTNSVLRILKNETYIGTFVTGKTRNKLTEYHKTIPVKRSEWIRHSHHQIPIIDEITFYKVQGRLNKRSFLESKKIAEDDFFCGRLYCDICGRKMKRKKAVNGSIYYVCPRKDESNSCQNKARSAEKLKKQVYQYIRLKIDAMLAYRNEMLRFEKTPYFLNWEKEQQKQLEMLKTEQGRQITLFKELYENSITYRRNNVPDTKALFRYLNSVRNVIHEKILQLDLIMEEYWHNESSRSERVQPFLEFVDCNFLIQEMIQNLVNTISLGVDDVDVRFIDV